VAKRSRNALREVIKKGQIDIMLTVIQTGSGLNGTMLDAVLNWIKNNLTANLPTGWTLTTQIMHAPTQYTVTIKITQTGVTVTGTLYDQVLAWLQTNATSKLPANYAMVFNNTITP